MSIRKSITMLNNTGREMNVVGQPIKSDGYFGYTDGIHSVQIFYSNFTGGIGIQGTLSTGVMCNGELQIPEEDWFWIHLSNNPNYLETLPYIMYPKDPLSPTATQPNSIWVNGTGDTGTELFTFIGNFVYLRAVMTREHLEPAPENADLLGQVDKVLLSL